MMDERIAKAVMGKIANQLADEFEKVAVEFKKIAGAIDGLDKRIKKLEKTEKLQE